MNHLSYYRFILRCLVSGLLRFIATTIVSSKMTYNHLMEEGAEVLYGEANLIASNYSTVYQGKPIGVASAYPQLEAVAAFTQTEIWVVECKGTIMVDGNHSGKVGATTQGSDPVSIDNKSHCVGSYYDCLPGEAFSVSAPITGNYNTYGCVIIRLPLSQIMAAQNGILSILYISVGITFALSLIILLVLTQTVYIPLKKITATANQYAERSLKYKTELHTHDEMGYLTATLSYMSDGLDQMEEYQHTFITNVFHDFRSPLTSIEGYLKAILDGAIPPEIHEEYLARIITGTGQLNKLTQDILTLSPLDSRGYLSRTSFDINRVVEDTAASLEGTCENKNIMLDLTFSDSIQMVYAGIGRIQQVLYSLIDSAIKFSHYDSTIYIQASIKGEKVFVSVKDTGIDIPRPSQKKTWERFYRPGSSRGKDKKRTDLGLTIVKEVIQNHDENIDCISMKGVGMEFIFSPPWSTNS